MLIVGLLACTHPHAERVDEVSIANGLDAVVLRIEGGPEIVAIADHSSPTVAWQTWVESGSANDPSGAGGTAHLFEHLAFGPTSEWGEGEWDEQLVPLGAVGIDAWTWLDETVFVQSVPTDAVPTLAHMDAVRFREMQIDQGALDRERKVVGEERSQKIEADPSALVRERLWGLAFPDDPYGRPTSGSAAELATVDPAACEAFRAANYRTDRVRIVVAGDIDPDALGQLIADEWRPTDADPPVEPDGAGFVPGGRVTITVDAETDRVALGFPLPSAADDDAIAVLVLDAVLTGGQGGVLRRSLETTGVAMTVESRAQPMRRTSLWEIAVQARPGVPAGDAEAALWSLLASVRTGVAPEDVERAKAQLLAQIGGQLEDGAGRAALVGWWARGSSLDRVSGLQDRIEAVTPERLTALADRLLVPESAVVVAGIGRGATTPKDRPIIAIPPAYTGPEVSARAVGEPIPAGAADESWGGAHLSVESDPRGGLVSLRMGWPAGSVVESTPGLASVASRGLLRGTAVRRRSSYEAAVERLGASVDIDVDTDAVVLRARVPREGWPALAALLAEALQAPAYDMKEVDGLQSELVNRMVRRLDDRPALATRAFEAVLFGADHPYARSPVGTPAGIATIGPHLADEWRTTWLVAEGAVLSLSGPVDDAGMADLRSLVAAMPQGARPDPVAVPPAPPADRRVILVDDPDATQAFVVIGGTGPSLGDPDLGAFRLGDQVLGGGFSSILVRDLRVGRGLVYQIGSGALLRPNGASTWTVGFAPPPETTVDAIVAVLDDIAKARVALPEADAARIRSASTASRPFLLDTAARRSWIGFRRELAGIDELALRDRTAAATTEEAVRALARVLDPDRALIVIVGPAATLQPQIGRLGGQSGTIPFDHVW